MNKNKTQNKSVQAALTIYLIWVGYRHRGRETMFRLIAIDFSQKSPHFSLLSPTSPCELSEREVTSPSNLKVVGTLDNYSLVFVIFINFIGQLKD